MVGDLAESNLDKTFNLGKKTNKLEILLLKVLVSRNSSKPPPVSQDKAQPGEAKECDCCQGSSGSSGEEASSSS